MATELHPQPIKQDSRNNFVLVCKDEKFYMKSWLENRSGRCSDTEQGQGPHYYGPPGHGYEVQQVPWAEGEQRGCVHEKLIHISCSKIALRRFGAAAIRKGIQT